uniref:Uncharacterized protein n=1 Tax=Anguilla anguilla TaxID=7936 RepID=A0A0E9STC6_ANGAN
MHLRLFITSLFRKKNWR